MTSTGDPEQALDPPIDREAKWFHSIELKDGTATNGRFPRFIPPNYTLFGVFDCLSHIDLKGCRCIDVGTMDGLTSFAMKSMGAENVIATDLAQRETFQIARANLGLEIDYQVPRTAIGLPESIDQPADLIVAAGILYHVFDPLTNLVALRKCLRPGGLLAVETISLFHVASPSMRFNPNDRSLRGINRANIFWRPSPSALCGMLELSGFQVLTSILVGERLTVLAKAMKPSEIASDSQRMEEIFRHYPSYVNYREVIDYEALEGDQSSESSIRYTGPTGHRYLFRSAYKPSVPHHPKWSSPNRWIAGLDIWLELLMCGYGLLKRLGYKIFGRITF